MRKLLRYRHLALTDLIRKVLYVLWRSARGFRGVRALRALYHFKNAGVILGSNVQVYGQALDIAVGEAVHIFPNAIFEFGDGAKLRIGDRITFSYGVLVSCAGEISVGNDVQVGEYTSIRDSTHSHADSSKPIRAAPDTTLPIKIGNDVWIGRGCLILPGTVIDDGVVLGANSVARGHLKGKALYAGAPARFIKSR